MKKYFLLFLLVAGCSQQKKSPATSGIIDTLTVPLPDTLSAPPKADMVTPENRLIIPGKSIGLTSINESNEQIFKKLGRADEGDAAMGKSLQKWYGKPVISGRDTIMNETDIYFVTNMGGPDEASRADHIRITSSFFITASQIRVGSSVDKIQASYPDIQPVATYISPRYGKVSIYDDMNAGIAFEIDHDGKCIGITVHRPHQKAFATYIAFFKDFKVL